MENQDQPKAENQDQPKAENQGQPKAKSAATNKINYKDYLAQQEKERKKKPLEIPSPVKIILSIPFLIIACFGLFYLPFMAFQVATSPAHVDKETHEVSVLKKSNAK